MSFFINGILGFVLRGETSLDPQTVLRKNFCSPRLVRKSVGPYDIFVEILMLLWLIGLDLNERFRDEKWITVEHETR